MTPDEIRRRYPLIAREVTEHLLPTLGRNANLGSVREALAKSTTYGPDRTPVLPPLGFELLHRLEGLDIDLPAWASADRYRTLRLASLIAASAFPDAPRELEAFIAISDALAVPTRVIDETSAPWMLGYLLEIGYSRWEWLHDKCMEAVEATPGTQPRHRSLADYGVLDVRYFTDRAHIVDVLRARSGMLANLGSVAGDTIAEMSALDTLVFFRSAAEANRPQKTVRVHYDLKPWVGLSGIAVSHDSPASSYEKGREMLAILALPNGRVRCVRATAEQDGEAPLFASIVEQLQRHDIIMDTDVWEACIHAMVSTRPDAPDGVRYETPASLCPIRVPLQVLDATYARSELPEPVPFAIQAGRSVRHLSTFGFRALLRDDEAGDRLRRYTIANPLLGEIILHDRILLNNFVTGSSPLETLRDFAPALTPGHLKRLEGISGLEIEAADPLKVPCETSRMLLRLYSEVSPQWAPERGRWSHLLVTAILLERIETILGGLPRQDLLRGCGGRWAQFIDRICRKGGFDIGPTDVGSGPMPQKVSDLRDPVRALSRELIGPLMLCRHAMENPEISDEAIAAMSARADDVARDILYRGKSLPRIFETSADWHANHGSIRCGLPGKRIPDWTPLCRPVRFGDIEIVPLSSPDQIAEEGSPLPDDHGVPGMHHCVASRTQDYATGLRHLCSVRRITPDGTGPYERLSTAEFAYLGSVGGTETIVIAEHTARKNGRPGKESADVVESFIKAVADGSVPLSPDLPTENEVAEQGSGFSYDWRDPANVEQALRAWEVCLPRRLRRLSLEAFPIDVEVSALPPEVDVNEWDFPLPATM